MINQFTHTHTYIYISMHDHRTPLVKWSLHKYKCLWSVGGKGRSSSLQEGVSHTYILRLGQSRILSCKKKKKYYA